MKTLLLIYLAIYIVALVVVSYFISKKEEGEGFLIANRDRKWWIISSSHFASSIGVGYFVAFTGYAYEFGLGVYLIIIGSILGYSFFGLWAGPRIYKHSREKSFYTQGDFVQNKTNSETAKLTVNLVGNLVLFGWLLIGVVGGAKIISHFGLMNYEFALISTVLVVMSYILIAGYKAVLATDILQSFVILGLVLLLVWAVIGGGNMTFGQILAAQTGTIDMGTALGFLIFGVLAAFSYPSYYQLVYASKNEKAFSKGVLTAIVPEVLVATILLMLGMYMYTINTGLDSGLVFLVALQENLPAVLLPVGILLFFAGLMSSADTNIYSISSHYVLSRHQDKPIRKVRWAIVIICFISVALGLIFRDLIGITVFVASISVILSPAMIYIIAGGKNHSRFMGSIVGGVITLIVGLIIVGIEPTLILFVLLGNILGFIFNERCQKFLSKIFKKSTLKLNAKS